jgi:hypothetical protein
LTMTPASQPTKAPIAKKIIKSIISSDNLN